MAILSRFRPYQSELYQQVRVAFADGHRQIMAMSPTGSGKTIISAGIIEQSLLRGTSRPGRPALFIVPRITLATQTARSFYDLGFERVSILQSDHPGYDRAASVQVCSAQTLEKRPELFGDVGLVIIDEAHIKRRFYATMREQWPGVPTIGLSATPTSRGLRKMFTSLCVGATTEQLVSAGYLVTSQVFEPSAYDVTGVASAGTESGYNERQLAAAIDGQREIHGHVVANWIENGENRPTLCFPVNCDHSREIVARFIDNGVAAMHIDARTDIDDRDIAFERLAGGELSVISSVGCLTEGLDIPEASCVIGAAPVKSLERHIQMIGRGLRKPGAEHHQNCLIFDHGGNYLRLMHHEDYAPRELDDGQPRDPSQHLSDKARAEGQQNLCSRCHAVKRRGIHQCQYCGHAPAPLDTNVTEIGGRLVAGGERAKPVKTEDRRQWYRMLKGVAERKDYKPGWIYHKYLTKFDGEKPPREWNHLAPAAPNDECERWIRSQAIRYAKGRARASEAAA